VLREALVSIPGSDTQRLLLLNKAGQLLDCVSCSVNARLTQIHHDSATFRVDVINPPDCDGGQLVFRYLPEKDGSVSGNWSHDINYRHRTYTFHWDQSRVDVIPSAIWEKKGLCRVAVANERFFVVFPRLRPP
jgi:hypothetical protein